MPRLTAFALSAVLLALSASAAAAGGTVPKLLSCGGKPLLRPSGLVVLSCADANSQLDKTQWSSWTRTSAKGTTDFGVNLCTPNCASSKMSFFAKSPVTLSAPKQTSHGLLFTRATITYTLHEHKRTFTAYPAS